MHEDIQAKLDQYGIRTFADLDKLRFNSESEFYCKSRFNILKEILGENTAINIFHELAAKSCF